MPAISVDADVEAARAVDGCAKTAATTRAHATATTLGTDATRPSETTAAVNATGATGATGATVAIVGPIVSSDDDGPRLRPWAVVCGHHRDAVIFRGAASHQRVVNHSVATRYAVTRCVTVFVMFVAAMGLKAAPMVAAATTAATHATCTPHYVTHAIF